MTWQETAAKEKARIDESIPPEWRVQVPDDAGSAMDFVQASSLLTDDEKQITGLSAIDLVQKMAVGELTSVAVTTAFCKRAALAHQLVSITVIQPMTSRPLLTRGPRSIAISTSSLKWPSPGPRSWTSTIPSTRSPRVLSTACPSLSRISSASR